MKSHDIAGRLAAFKSLPREVQAEKLRSKILGPTLGRLYIDLNHSLDSSLLVSGTPRSGSTWLANLLIEFLRFRLIFEPIALGEGEMQRYEYRYLRTTDPDPYLRSRLESLLTGREPDPSARNRQVLARGRLVKGVATNLLLGWFRQQFPTVPVVFTVRHPLLVVGSYMKMSWLTPKQPAHWLTQEELMADHLEPFRRTIESAVTPLRRSAVEWCVLNYVPKRAENRQDWIQVRYEDLVLEPELTLANIVRQLGIPDRGFRWSRISAPSHTAETSVGDRATLVDTARSGLSDSERKEVEWCVREFGLDEYLQPGLRGGGRDAKSGE